MTQFGTIRDLEGNVFDMDAIVDEAASRSAGPALCQVALTAGQVTASVSVPTEFLPAPGSGKFYNVHRAEVFSIKPENGPIVSANFLITNSSTLLFNFQLGWAGQSSGNIGRITGLQVTSSSGSYFPPSINYWDSGNYASYDNSPLYYWVNGNIDPMNHQQEVFLRVWYTIDSIPFI